MSLTPNDTTSADFHGCLMGEFSNSSTPGSTTSNEQRKVSLKFPSTFSSPSSSSGHLPLTVGSTYKTHSEYCPSPNVHPLQTQSEAPSPLSIFSPSFTQTLLFSSPNATGSKKVEISVSSFDQSKRDQVSYSSPSGTKKRMRNSDSNTPHISQFNRIAYAALPLRERLKPQKNNEGFLSISHRSSSSTGAKDFQDCERSAAYFPHNQDVPNESKPHVATSNNPRSEEIVGIPIEIMLKRRINAVGVILQSTATLHERKWEECTSSANTVIPNKLPRVRETSKSVNSKGTTKIRAKPRSLQEVNGNCGLKIIDRNDLTSVAVSLLNMASGYDSL